jgi:hypothetical protein
MAAAGVESASVTDWADVNVPAAGEKVGAAATGIAMVYSAEVVLLTVSPEASAMAWMVVVTDTGMAAEYVAELVLGAVPSVV